MKKLLLVGAITLAAAQSYAQDYQAEVGLVYGTIDASGVDGSAIGLSGIVYFDRVDTSKGPLAEAAFLDKASGISLTYLSTEFDGSDSEDTTGLNLRYVASEKWIIEASYSSEENDDDLGFGFGAYLTDNIDLVGHYVTSDFSDSIDVTMHGVVPANGEAAFTFDLGLKNISPDDGDSVSAYNLGAGYYFTKSFGVSASYSSTSDDFDVSSTVVGADWFVKENIDLSLSYSMSTFGNLDIDILLLSASMRF